MNIPFVDLQAQLARIEPNLRARMDAVLKHGQFILGPEIRELEARLAAFGGVAHAVSASSGSDALLMVLMAKGIGKGDAVFLPAFTFTATAEIVLLAGATPVFVDVSEDDFNIDLADLERRVAAVKKAGALNPAAVVPVDLFGLPARHEELAALARRHGLFVLCDAAQSFGAETDGVRVGGYGDATALSFFPAKPLGCYGDGGAVLTPDAELASVLRSIRAHGQGGGKYDIVRVGLNARLDTLQAAILLAKLDVFEDELAARNRIARAYSQRLSNLVKTPPLPDGVRSAWAQYTIQLDGRDRVAEEMKKRGVPTAVYYPRPMHLQPAYRDYGDGPGSLPASERLVDRVLSLPMHPYLDDAMAARVCDALAESLEAARH
jgi:UDP-2-acetamido-2-deoxy-ribo-hexuluronate aminotransferase